MKVGLAGDWHGNERWAYSALMWFSERGVKTVYQVGDFGVTRSLGESGYVRGMARLCETFGMTVYVTPGNHEWWPGIMDAEGELQWLTGGEDEGWGIALMPRGYQWSVEGRTFISLGGAPSIDGPDFRSEGSSWFPTMERIREEHLERLAPAEVMLTHDAPSGGTATVDAIHRSNPQGWSENALAYAREGREMLDRAYSLVDPVLLVHGHMHVYDYKETRSGRAWLALHMDGYDENVAILETDTLEVKVNAPFTDWSNWPDVDVREDVS